jgi:hypothetical protein
MPGAPKDLFDINPAGPCVALKSGENVPISERRFVIFIKVFESGLSS